MFKGKILGLQATNMFVNLLILFQSIRTACYQQHQFIIEKTHARSRIAKICLYLIFILDTTCTFKGISLGLRSIL